MNGCDLFGLIRAKFFVMFSLTTHSFWLCSRHQEEGLVKFEVFFFFFFVNCSNVGRGLYLAFINCI